MRVGQGGEENEGELRGERDGGPAVKTGAPSVSSPCSPRSPWFSALSRRLALGAGVLLVSIVLLAALFVAWPLPPELLARRDVVSLRFTDREGGLLREMRSRADGRSVPLLGGVVPPRVAQAFIAAEDRRFYRHPGVDPLAMARALWQNLRARRVVSGASTITQQLARQLRPRGPGLAGKASEALWALRLGLHLPRERILREYLDRVPLGNSVHGVEAAAELYFGRPAAELSVGQAALLAGMARSPARYDPYRHPERARGRQAAVLAALVATGMLDAEGRRVAAQAPLDLVPRRSAFRAPHLVQRLWSGLDRLGLDRAARIETTLDPALQADVEHVLWEELRGLAARGVSQAAAIVVDNASGEVLAYVGSADFFDEATGGQNDGVAALRQPGSTLKPFAYGLALASGYTPASVLADLEARFPIADGEYVPQNYDRRAHGPVRLRAALANSYNVPAVRLADRLRPERLLDVLHRAGFASLRAGAEHYGVGLVLGNGDVSLYELARAYRGLARGGVVGPLVLVRAAADAAGRPLPVAPELPTQRFLPEPAVALLTDVLSDAEARTPAFGSDNALRLPFPAAAKTGTSRAHVDNWTVGFTRERTVAVWVGNFDGTPMQGVSGITGAGPIFRRVMIRAMRGIAPAGLVDRSRFAAVDVCPLSGKRAGPACPGVLHEVFLPGSEPVETCPMHQPAGEAGRGGEAVGPGGQTAVLDVGPEYYAWAAGQGLPAGPAGAGVWSGAGAGAGVGVGAGSGAGTGAGTGTGMATEPDTGAARLLAPRDGAQYMLLPHLPASDQAIPVRVLAPRGVALLELRDERGEVQPLPPPFVGRVPARPGRHRLELWLPGGSAALAGASYVVHGP